MDYLTEQSCFLAFFISYWKEDEVENRFSRDTSIVTVLVSIKCALTLSPIQGVFLEDVPRTVQ